MSIPIAVIAGIPRGAHQRARAKPVRPRWNIRVIPSNQDRRADLRGVWTNVMNVVDQAGSDGVHLILSHYLDDERPKFYELKSRSYRAVWLSRRLSSKYGHPDFNTAINEILAFEECWRDRIRPSINSPLLLPNNVFSASESVSNVWDRARRVHRGRDGLQAVENAIDRFRAIHWKDRGWRDIKALVFARSPIPHGSHGIDLWQSKKLTFQLPTGTHFDVKHLRGGSFRVVDQHGNLHTFNQYTNIDPHGFVRGGR